MNPIRFAVVALPFVLAHVPAQETTTAAIPPGPQIFIDTVGPDGWRMRLGPTNLGSLLASEQGRAMWTPQVDPLMGMWRHVFGDDASFTAARDVLLGYGGRVRVGAWLPEGDGFGDRIASAAIVLDGDGRTDLDQLAAELRRLQAKLDGKWTKTDLDGTTVDTIVHGDDVMTAPLVEGKAILLALGSKNDVATALLNARMLARDHSEKITPASPALGVRIGADGLVKRFGAPDEVRKVLGLDSLHALLFHVGTAGPRVQFEVSLSFTSDERGLFAALFPATQGIPDLQRFCDPKSSWKVGRFDWKALWLTAEKLLKLRDLGEEDIRAEAKKELGIDPVDDLLAHMTDEVMVSVGAIDDPERLRDTPWTFAVRLRDQAAFGKGLDAALAHAKPMLSREASVENADGELRRYGNFLGYDLWITTGQGLFAIAAGANAEDRLKALLAAAKAAKADAPKDADFEALARHLPRGVNGLAHGAVDSMIAAPLGAWMLGMGDVAPEVFGVHLDSESREQFLELLKKHELHTVRTASGFADSRWCWRLFW